MKIRIKHHYIISFFFITVAVIGVNIFKDYGIATDEYINRINGGVSLNYILEIIYKFTGIKIWENDSELLKLKDHISVYKDKDYGVAFDLPVMIIERLLSINSSQHQYLFRHFVTNAVFIIGVYYFYKTLNDRYNNWQISLFGALALYLTPRIFAESFYNNKDLVFMSFFTVALYYSIKLIKNPNISLVLIASLTTALATNTRIIGIIILIITSTLLILKYLTDGFSFKNIKFLFIYICSAIIFIILLWPWLWENPLNHFIEAFANMAKFRWLNWVLYRGYYYPSTDLPWHYLPVWMVITTPILYIILFPIGLISVLINIYFKKSTFLKNNNIIQDLVNISIVLVPITAAVIMKSTIYDGWRQFYFLYPSVLYISIISIVNLWFNKIKYILLLLITISLLSNIYWIYTNHPYQNVYFNIFASKNWNTKFETDYWGLTNTEGIRNILTNDIRENIKIYSVGNTSIPQAFLMLDKKEQHRLQVVDKLSEADYALTNFRFLIHPKDFDDYKEMVEKFNLSYQITVDKKVIFKIYKKAVSSTKCNFD